MKRPRYYKKQRRKSRYKQGFYLLKNPEKYRPAVDKTMNPASLPFFRSSYEYKFYKWVDENEDIEYWGTESISIKYYDTQKNKIRRYYPDVFLKFKDGKKMIVEIKPASQCKMQNNLDKWESARNYARQIDAKFIVLTEKELGIKK